MDGYQPTTGDHAENLAAALDRFHRALTRRWREEVCRALSEGREDYPRAIRHTASAAGYQSPWWSTPAWDYTLLPNWRHVLSGTCAYMVWAETGQDGDPGAVSCQGVTNASSELWTNPYTGEEGLIPANVDCGMDRILTQVEDWAYAERQHVYQQLPLFGKHDMAALQQAHDTFVELGAKLGLEPDAASAPGATALFQPMSERDIASQVDWLSGDRTGADWWAGWTGLAASRVKAGFFASVAPTLNNQSGIVGSLANLYAERASIIEKGRNDVLYWLEWATASLDATVAVPDRTGWLMLQGFGAGVSAVFGWSGIGAVVGAAVSLSGFLAEHLAGTEREEYLHDMVEVVGRVNDEVSSLNRDIGGLEIGYSADVDRLQEIIHTIHSYNLELYDLTQNDPDGDREPGDGGFSADIGAVLGVAQACYELGEQHAGLLPIFVTTSSADLHLADQDGQQTLADQRTLEVRDLLGELLRTTSARYLVAGEQVLAAAEAYVAVDTSQKETYDAIMTDWEREGIGEVDVRFEPEQYAHGTERSSGWAPSQEHGHARPGPGEGDGDDYRTESDDEGRRNG